MRDRELHTPLVRESLSGSKIPRVALPRYEDEIFYGYMVPARTPADAIRQLADWFSGAMDAAEVKPRLAQQGLFTTIRCGSDFATYLHTRIDEYSRVVREANIKAE